MMNQMMMMPQQMPPRPKKMMDIGFIGGTAPGRYSKISRAATYNMVVSDGALVPYSGYETVLSLGDKSDQARQIYGSILYDHMIVVIDENVYSISNTLGFFRVGILQTRAGDVFIADNGNSQIAISDLNFYYVYNYGTGVFETYDLGYKPGPIWPQGSRIFATILGSNTFRYSAPNDAKSWDVRDGGEIGNDRIQTGCGLGNVVFVFGSKIAQVWVNLGTATAPYKLNSSINILYGTANRNSVAAAFGKVVWLGSNNEANNSILMSDGGIPRPVSTPGIDFLISELKEPQNCVGFLFEEDGHTFYQLTFLSSQDNVTLVYDFTSGEFLNASDENLNQHIARNIVFFNGDYYFISNKNAKLYRLSSDLYTYDGAIIPRIRITPPFRLPTYKFFAIKNMQLIAEQGETNLPMNVDLSLSKDGGRTFGNVMRRQLGALGNRRAVTQWQKLGWNNYFCFQFRFYGANRFVLLGVSTEAQ